MAYASVNPKVLKKSLLAALLAIVELNISQKEQQTWKMKV